MSSRRTKLPAGWESGISDDYEYVPCACLPTSPASPPPCGSRSRPSSADGNCPASASTPTAAAACCCAAENPPPSSCRPPSPESDRVYRLLLRLLFLVPPERVHHLVFAAIRLAAAFGPTRALMQRLFTVDDPVLHRQVFGVRVPCPARPCRRIRQGRRGVDAWGPLGFGFAEVGPSPPSHSPATRSRGCFDCPKTTP